MASRNKMMAVALMICITRKLKLVGLLGSFFRKKYMMPLPRDSFQCPFGTLVRRIYFVVKPAVSEDFAHGIVEVTRDDQVAETTPLVVNLGGQCPYADGITFGDVLDVMPPTRRHKQRLSRVDLRFVPIEVLQCRELFVIGVLDVGNAMEIVGQFIHEVRLLQRE